VVSGVLSAGQLLSVRAETAVLLPWEWPSRGQHGDGARGDHTAVRTVAEATAAGSGAVVVGLPGPGVLAAADVEWSGSA